MIRVGVIGYGTMGQVHSQAWQQLKDVQLVAVADPDSHSRAQAQRDYGIDVLESAQELLDVCDPDLVDICVPTYLHESVMAQAIAAHKHIFCEKPLARHLAEGRRMLEMAKGYQKKIGIGHVVRFTPAYQGIRQAILEGQIGTAAVARTFRGGSLFPSGWHDWFSDYDLSGGAILDLAIHDLDFLRWLFGDVQRVYAKSTHGRTTAHLERAMIVLRFTNGVIAHVESSWANYPGEFYTTVEIAGKDGLISFDSRETNPVLKITADNNKVQPGVSVPAGIGAENPYFLELQERGGISKEISAREHS